MTLSRPAPGCLDAVRELVILLESKEMLTEKSCCHFLACCPVASRKPARDSFDKLGLRSRLSDCWPSENAITLLLLYIEKALWRMRKVVETEQTGWLGHSSRFQSTRGFVRWNGWSTGLREVIRSPLIWLYCKTQNS